MELWKGSCYDRALCDALGIANTGDPVQLLSVLFLSSFRLPSESFLSSFCLVPASLLFRATVRGGQHSFLLRFVFVGSRRRVPSSRAFSFLSILAKLAP